MDGGGIKIDIFVLIYRIHINKIMDLHQNKLSKAEWESIEKPVNSNEKDILKLIIEGI